MIWCSDYFISPKLTVTKVCPFFSKKMLRIRLNFRRNRTFCIAFQQNCVAAETLDLLLFNAGKARRNKQIF